MYAINYIHVSDFEVPCEREEGNVVQCKAGLCIDKVYQCDGTFDCLPDGEDEMGCDSK